MTNKLKPCPCGRTPNSLGISTGNSCKYAYTYGSCCGEWNVEFRTNYHDLDSPACMELAIKAWDNTPRRGNKAAVMRNVHPTSFQCFLEEKAKDNGNLQPKTVIYSGPELQSIYLLSILKN